MKKNLLLISTLILTNLALAQTSISFESSEGYSLGSVNNQNNWTIYEPDEDSEFLPIVNITDERATEGANSLEVVSQNSFESSGASKTLETIDYNFSLSLDVFVKAEPESAMGSEIVLDLLNDEINFAEINFSIDNTIWAGSANWLSEIEGITYDFNKWYKVRYDVDLDQKTYVILLNDEIIFEDYYDAGTNLVGLDFFMFDYGSSFNIDNIEIKPLDDLSINNQQKNIVSIFPNPTSDFINIKTENKVESVEIFDYSGKLLLQQKSKKINIQHLNQGNYLLKITTDKGSLTKKIIKK